MTGLKLGERVVTEGGDRLKDGATVQLPGEAASTQARVAPTSDAKGAKGDVAGAAAHKGQRQGDGHRRKRGGDESAPRSEERGEGKGCGRKCRSRWAPGH